MTDGYEATLQKVIRLMQEATHEGIPALHSYNPNLCLNQPCKLCEATEIMEGELDMKRIMRALG